MTEMNQPSQTHGMYEFSLRVSEDADLSALIHAIREIPRDETGNILEVRVWCGHDLAATLNQQVKSTPLYEDTDTGNAIVMPLEAGIVETALEVMAEELMEKMNGDLTYNARELDDIQPAALHNLYRMVTLEWVSGRR